MSKRDQNLRAVAMMVLLIAPFTHAQTSQFLFDANGNLLVQSAELNAPPQITGPPQNQIVDAGTTASFFVVAKGAVPLSYQWLFNGVDLGGANADTLLLENVSASDEGEFRVVVSNASGSVTSAPAFLLLDTDHDGMGDTWEFVYFGSLIRTATGDFDGDGNSNLQEFEDRTDPTNSNSALFRLLVVSDAGTVMIAPDQPLYTNGQSVTLTAIPPPNGAFHAWLGDIVTRSNPVTLVMTNNKTVYARFTPITFTWINLAGGDWNTADNWTPNLVPGSNDSPVITSTVTVTLNTPADCANVTLGSVAGSSPTLTGTGPLTVRGHFLWASGTMSGSGRTRIEPGARLTLENPAQVSLTTRTLELGGETFWTGPGNVALNGAVITNRTSGVFEIESSTSFPMPTAASRIDNAGLIRKSFSGGTTTIESGVTFNNFGVVEIQTGTLNFAGGGRHSEGSSLTGAGSITFSGGSHDLAGLINVSGTHTFSGGTANLTGNYICTNNTLTIVGPVTANFSGTGNVAPAMLTLGSPGFNQTLTGPNTVTVLNTMNWTGGTMTGSGRTIIAPGATLNAAVVSSITISSRTLENAGTILCTGVGSIIVGSGAVITNRPGALFHVQNSGNIGGGLPNGRFDNAGIFRKSLDAGTTAFNSAFNNGVALNNYGIVELQAGTLSLSGGGTHRGNFNVSANATLAFSGGTHAASASSSITGAGHLTVSSGTADLAGLVNVSGTHTFSSGTANLTGNYIGTNNTVTISGNGTANFSGTGPVSPAELVLKENGVLTGPNSVTVPHTMNWTGGTMSGSGRTLIAPGATLNANPGLIVLSRRTLENGGTVLWTDGGIFGVNSGAVITNRAGALFHVQNAAGLGGGGANGRFDNAGTFRKSVNAGITTVATGMSLNNYGTVEIRSGILAANGGYNSTTNALLHCAIGGATPGTGFGQLQVAGAVTLNGSLSVDLINGFVPATNSSFAVLTAGTRNGAFASFSYPSNALTLQMSNTANSVLVRATDVFIVPQPAPVPVGLISWWRAEGNALDAFGTNHGVMTNGAGFATGQVGQTFALDGVNDYVSMPDSPSLRPVSVTIETWVKFFATNGIRLILAKPLGNSVFDSYGMALTDGVLNAGICDNSGFGTVLNHNLRPILGQWYHLAYTFDDAANFQALYVNGVLVLSAPENKSISYDSRPLLLGADIENGALSFFLNGQMDEPSIYNRALTGNEIATIYNAGGAGKQVGGAIPAPRLLTPEIIGANLNVIWTAVPNATYRLEYNPDLANLNNWTPVSGDVATTSNTASKLDPLTTSNRFYRVRVLP